MKRTKNRMKFPFVPQMAKNSVWIALRCYVTIKMLPLYICVHSSSKYLLIWWWTVKTPLQMLSSMVCLVSLKLENAIRLQFHGNIYPILRHSTWQLIIWLYYISAFASLCAWRSGYHLDYFIVIIPVQNAIGTWWSR